MSITAIIINLMALVSLLIAFIKDREKAKKSLKIAGKSFVRMFPPMVLTIIFIIGLLLGFVPPSQISRFIGEQSGIGGVLLIGTLGGAIMHIPALLSFPLAASLLEGGGASVTAVAAFITTLTMIGIVTLPLEIKELGRKMALLRNGLSFIIAIIIALIMGAIL
ncbi:permease [Thermococcus peptonophilus]|uniref:permease n=1 Tax=Thermococcus peptonophilus TaxID=53952 RepID=UPI0006D2686B